MQANGAGGAAGNGVGAGFDALPKLAAEAEGSSKAKNGEKEEKTVPDCEFTAICRLARQTFQESTLLARVLARGAPS